MQVPGEYLIRSKWNDPKNWGGHEWWCQIRGWGPESVATPYTPTQAKKMTLPVGGEWVFMPLQIKDDNNEEEMDVFNRRDGGDDNPVTD